MYLLDEFTVLGGLTSSVEGGYNCVCTCIYVLFLAFFLLIVRFG